MNIERIANAPAPRGVHDEVFYPIMTRVLTPFFKGKFPYFAPHTAPPAEEHSHDEENDGDEEKVRNVVSLGTGRVLVVETWATKDLDQIVRRPSCLEQPGRLLGPMMQFVIVDGRFFSPFVLVLS